MRRRFLLFNLALALSLAVPISAYDVYLKNGKVLTGTLVVSDEKSIQLRDKSGLLFRVSKDTVDLEKTAAGNMTQTAPMTGGSEQKTIVNQSAPEPATLEKKESIATIVNPANKKLSKEEAEKLSQKLQELTQSAEYKEAIRTTDEEIKKEKKEFEQRAQEKKSTNVGQNISSPESESAVLDKQIRQLELKRQLEDMKSELISLEKKQREMLQRTPSWGEDFNRYTFEKYRLQEDMDFLKSRIDHFQHLVDTINATD